MRAFFNKRGLTIRSFLRLVVLAIFSPCLLTACGEIGDGRGVYEGRIVFEGRVVDAPMAGAAVFVDLNGNNQLDANESRGTTDANGYFNIEPFTPVAGVVPKIISIGGTDSKTGVLLPKFALVSDVPADLSQAVSVTPLTTLLASVDTLQAKSQLLAALGVNGTPEALLTTDGWAEAEAGDEDAKAAQRVNQQLSLLFQTATTLTDAEPDDAVALAQSVVNLLASMVQQQGSVDLTSSADIQSILTQVIAQAIADEITAVDIQTAAIAAVADSVSNVNTVIADLALDPVSQTAQEVVKSTQEGLQTSVAELVAGEVNVTNFLSQTSPSRLFVNVVVSVGAPDNDNDGVPDLLDPDDETPPNIIFIIMDDVGVDQLTLFGYGGLQAGPATTSPTAVYDRQPQLPNIDAIGQQGVRFRNAWSMPACSTSRAVFFTGRYPIRTQVLGALGEDDLVNYHLSPYELTMPKLLKESGYQNALFGKFHIAMPSTSPFEEAMPSSLGWDYFAGWMDKTGDPSSIDTSAGLGEEYEGRYLCGFVPSEQQDPSNGADAGACYTANTIKPCSNIIAKEGIPPGRACRDAGGIFDPQQSCSRNIPTNIEAGFSTLSSHSVSPLWINDEVGNAIEVPVTDIRARTYRTTSTVNGAIEWIKARPTDTPWSATVSFASVHTPVIQPPQALLSVPAAAVNRLRCAAPEGASIELQNQVIVEQRELTTLMLEAMDSEISRLLVSIGVATLNGDQSLVLNTDANTMVVILGDNGTLGFSVKLPFDPGRAKGTAYQTGIWVPLLVAGPLVNEPNREVDEMVNIVDLFELFAEISGTENVHEIAPRTLDSEPMMPYLSTPGVESQRQYNFTYIGNNRQAGGTINQPCTFISSCSHIPVSNKVCRDNGGVWWGAGSAEPGVPVEGYTSCCQVNQNLYEREQAMLNLNPLTAAAIRNDSYKLIKNTYVGDATPPAASYPHCDATAATEFYRINEDKGTPKIDREGDDLVNPATGLPEDSAEQIIFNRLSNELTLILESVQPCPSNAPDGYLVSIDGNKDGVIDATDLENLDGFAKADDSSWYDIDLSGTTDSDDYTRVNDYLGIECLNE